MSLDGIYSVSLLFSWIAAGIGIIVLSVALYSHTVHVTHRVALGCWVLPVLFLAISVITHVVGGHRPGTANALSAPAFIAAYPGFLIAAGLALACYLLYRKT